tara:strand:+ start:3116 stop:3340 length:225 start_codon:yes stop_codon:yes gene_type:complete
MEIEALKNKLEEQLESHDWFFEYSDDQRYWRAGNRERAEIFETIEEFKEAGENEYDFAMEMYKQYKPVIPSPEG